MKAKLLKRLARIGLIRIRDDGSIRWPLHFAPSWMWKSPLASLRFSGLFYLFRNRPGIIKWEEGRLLPRRWGFGIAGLIEFGDRG